METFLPNDRIYSHAGQSPSDQESVSSHLKQQVENKASFFLWSQPLSIVPSQALLWRFSDDIDLTRLIGHTLSPTSNYLLN